MAKPRIHTLAELRTLAKYVKALKVFISTPDEHVTDEELDALVKEKARVQRHVYNRVESLNAKSRLGLLKLMHEPNGRSRKPNARRRPKKAAKPPAVPVWTPEQQHNLNQWRRMGLFYQRM